MARLSPQASQDVHCQKEEWRRLWPAEALVSWIGKLPEDTRFGDLREIADSGNFYFSSFEEGVGFLPHFGKSGPGQLPVPARALGAVFAARDPEGFLAWRPDEWDYAKRETLEAGIEVLLRRDPSYIKRIIPLFRDDDSAGTCAIAREWARYDHEAALEWAESFPKSREFERAKGFKNVTPAPRFTPEEAAGLIGRHFQNPPREEVRLEELEVTTLRGGDAEKWLEELAERAIPGASPLANLELYETVFSLNLATVKVLLGGFELTPARNAKEKMVRSYLLEQWAFLEPADCGVYLLESGNGEMRQLLPLAFSQLRNAEPGEVHDWLLKIPERELYEICAKEVGLF